LGGDVAASNLDKVVNFVRRNGGLDYAEQKARGYVQKAIAVLRGLDGFPGRMALEGLAEMAAARDK
jgi:geranylgeranyl pyrophosphate synthase